MRPAVAQGELAAAAAPPLAAWFGQYMGDAFKHTLEQTLASPSPR